MCDEASKLADCSSDSLRNELKAFIGCVMRKTDLSENNAVEAAKAVNSKTTADMLMQLSGSFNENDTSSTLSAFISLDNDLSERVKDYGEGSAKALYLVYQQLSAELFSLQPDNSIADFTDRFLDNMRNTISTRLAYTISFDKFSIKSLNAQPSSPPPSVPPRSSSIRPAPSPAPAFSPAQHTLKELRIGERADFSAFTDNNIRISLTYERINGTIDLDGYAFLLGANGKVLSDYDLIFFGNEVSGDQSVKAVTSAQYPGIEVCLNKVGGQYDKVDICFSAYGDDEGTNFQQVIKPVIRIYNGNEELFFLQLKNLFMEKCLVGVEFYRNKGSWKIKAVGAGYNGKLKTLCESFGVEIE